MMRDGFSDQSSTMFGTISYLPNLAAFTSPMGVIPGSGGGQVRKNLISQTKYLTKMAIGSSDQVALQPLVDQSNPPVARANTNMILQIDVAKLDDMKPLKAPNNQLLLP